MTIGEALRLVRDEAGLTQPQIADELGESQANVSRWESDTNRPSLEQIGAFEQAANVASGTVLRLAGFVIDAATTAEAIAGDAELTPGWRHSLLNIYDEAVRDSAGGRSGRKAAPRARKAR